MGLLPAAVMPIGDDGSAGRTWGFAPFPDATRPPAALEMEGGSCSPR
jgi:hypothetical protein